MLGRLLHTAIVAATLTASLATHAATSADMRSNRPFTVVIDAGHGGKDYGCIGDVANEKTITLDVSRRLAALVQENLPEVRAVLTRDDDRFLSLQERARSANNHKADLFVSIHVNSVDKRSRGREKVHGASVYVLGPDKAAKSMDVAVRENAVIELEEDNQASYQGFDPQSDESYIIFELNESRHLAQSLEFANLAQRALINDAGRADKNVRQAGFWVLWATSMPAVLVELDFICNPEAERFLNSENGREKCALALFNALKRYYNDNSDKNKNNYIKQ